MNTTRIAQAQKTRASSDIRKAVDILLSQYCLSTPAENNVIINTVAAWLIHEAEVQELRESAAAKMNANHAIKRIES